MIAIFTPFIGIGKVDFGASIKEFIEDFDYDYLSKADGYIGEMYLIDNPKMTFGVDDDGKVIDIICDEECIYKERNLIGMTLEEFIRHTGEKYYGDVNELDFQDDDIPQYVYEFEDIGLQVWVKGVDGKIVTVIASTNDGENLE